MVFGNIFYTLLYRHTVTIILLDRINYDVETTSLHVMGLAIPAISTIDLLSMLALIYGNINTCTYYSVTLTCSLNNNTYTSTLILFGLQIVIIAGQEYVELSVLLNMSNVSLENNTYP